MKEPRNANLVEPQIGRRLIGSSLFTFNNANKVFAGYSRREHQLAALLLLLSEAAAAVAKYAMS